MPVFLVDEVLVGAVVTFMDNTERKKSEENIRYLTYHDPLTDIHNRLFFEKEVPLSDTEENLPISVIFGDVNGLKLTNDIFGHAAGDMLLERIARRGIAYEHYIDRAYLERLNEAYARFFHEYNAAPLLIVNAAQIDPVSNQADFDELLGAIRRMKRGRLYYNPLRHAAL